MSDQTPNKSGFDVTRRPWPPPRRTSARRAVNLIALSRAITFSGGNAAFIALLAAFYQETKSAELVGIGALASFAVPALASPLAGWVGDRFDRRKVMIASEALGALCFCLMAVFATAPVLLLILRVAASLLAAPLNSATAAALPGIVGSEEELSAANAKLAAAGTSGALVGPLVAAVLLLFWGPSSVFAFNAITFLVSAGLLISIKANFRPTPDHDEMRHGADLAAGFRYLGRHSALRPVTLAYLALSIGVGLTAPAEVALSRDFGAGATGYAALACAFAVGGIAGSQLGGRGLPQTSAERTAIMGAASGMLALGFLLVGFAPLFGLALAGMGVAGMADGIWIVAHENLIQRMTPDAIRARVFAGSDAVYLGGVSLGLLGAGGVVSACGAASTFRIGAVGSLLAFVLLAVAAGSLGKLANPAAARRARVPVAPIALALTASARAPGTADSGHPTELLRRLGMQKHRTGRGFRAYRESSNDE